ncbi:glycoside hydrolase family 16 protein [Gordonia sp. ABSL1-1]|uniref:glycoside hydrolase family 16 protein n=1 Tax=Gordonia sp. ABSL1-1 TaxID=3053923 RepID=UPI002573B5F3|nr:glycoside hydrolase family 16 protein [Gordonia sp. ABSL1-1]MDL9936079.1 glycoside hydrolase family 16 protein [Gordonia sp. ABSL1-1]
MIRNVLTRPFAAIARVPTRLRHYLTALVVTPNGRPRPAGAVIFVCLAVTFLVVCTSLDAAARGREQSDDFTRLRSDLGLVASDDFSGPAGHLPSGTMWNIRTGGGGWGNDEQQIYTAATDNIATDGRGNLVITARRSGSTITSARIDTLGKLDASTGLIAVRAKLPQGAGLHPGIWMLGSSIDVVGYPEAGEIDLFEQVNNHASATVGALGPRTDLGIKTPWKVQVQPPTETLADPDGFHTYWVNRSPGRIEFGIDGKRVMTLTPKDLPRSSVWVFDDPFFVVLNLAAGGEWPGPLDPSSLPASMLVDWVRVYA